MTDCKKKDLPFSGDSLDELAFRAGRGSDEDFSRLVKHFKPAIIAMISCFNVPEAEKEDLMQEALIGLYKAAKLFNPDLSSFSTFARVCIRSALLDGIRKYPGETEFLDPETFELDLLAPCNESPDRILIGKEELRELMQKVDRNLSDLERRIFGLSLQGKKSSEIAKLLKKDPKSVENALYRLRRKLASPS